MGSLVGPEHRLWSQWPKDMESGRSPKERLSLRYQRLLSKAISSASSVILILLTGDIVTCVSV